MNNLPASKDTAIRLEASDAIRTALWPTLLASAELCAEALDQAVNITGDFAEQLRRRVPPHAADLFEGEVEPEWHVEGIAIFYLSEGQPGDLEPVSQRLPVAA
jgi:hypothetical protein